MTDGILRSVTSGSTVLHVPFPPPEADLLLDSYQNALVGYSLRKLRNAYAGSAIRLRRTSDNAEMDFGFVGNDFDAAGAAAWIVGEGRVVTAYDQSGNGINATQATAANQPTYVASGIGSMPGLILAPAADATWLASGSITAANIPVSAFSVAWLSTATSSNGRLISILANGESEDYNNNTSSATLYRNGTAQQIAAYSNGANSTGNVTYDVASVLASIYNKTNHVFYVDGSASTPVASTHGMGNASFTVFWGAENGSSHEDWTGYSSELILWGSDQAANVTGITADMATYYGI